MHSSTLEKHEHERQQHNTEDLLKPAHLSSFQQSIKLMKTSAGYLLAFYDPSSVLNWPHSVNINVKDLKLKNDTIRLVYGNRSMSILF